MANPTEDLRLAKSRGRTLKLEALVRHLRHCCECSETDVLNCVEGKALWVMAAMPFDDLQPFADGRLGCPKCGSYADSTGNVDHARDCERIKP